MNMAMLKKINYSAKKFPSSDMKKVFEVLDDEKFGTKSEKEVAKIVEKLKHYGSERDQGSKNNC